MCIRDRTFIESGLPGYAVTSWYGLALPAGTPAPIVEKITKAMQQVLEREKVREQIIKVGALPKRSTPEELRKHIESEIEQWQQVRETAGIQPVSYTHLRAHETVLDLVCRLLLE